MARFKIIYEVSNGDEGSWRLCFQYGTYYYDNKKDAENGYRFIWRRPDGSLQPARGQARIPQIKDIFELLALAAKNGWLNQ